MTKKNILNLILVAVVLIFSLLMLNTIRQYSTFETNVGFLRFKQNVIGNKYWLLFFYIHIFSITICLLAGLTQFSTQFLKENRKLHKIIGKIYVYNILIINFPACLLLSIFSNGGIIGISGFLIQNFLWVYFTLFAVISIKKGNIEAHQKYMILSYAITTTAITFRIIKNLFYREDIFSYELFYGINVWTSMLLNIIIAYIIIRKNRKNLSLESNRVDKNNKRNQ